MFRFIDALEKKVIKIFNLVAFILLLTMVVLVVFQIVARNYLHISVPWTEELSRVILVWMTFIGSVILISEKGHVVMDLLLNKLEGCSKKILLTFCYLVVAVFLAFLIYYGSILVINNLDTYLTSLRKVSRSWVYLSLPLNAFFMLFIWIKQFVESIVFSEIEEAGTIQ
jgi:TRAP-type transport system small permease protein